MPSQLWAPWRIEYLEGKREGCFFCEYAVAPAKMRENLVLVIQPHAIVCLNRYPFTTSHLLVAPRRHVSNLEDLSDDEYGAVTTLVRQAAVRLKKTVGCSALNIGFNLGKDAGAGVADHLHGHVVPRWAGDSNFLPVIADVRVMPQYLDEAWARLVPAFADVPGEHAQP